MAAVNGEIHQADGYRFALRGCGDGAGQAHQEGRLLPAPGAVLSAANFIGLWKMLLKKNYWVFFFLMTIAFISISALISLRCLPARPAEIRTWASCSATGSLGDGVGNGPPKPDLVPLQAA